MTNPEHVGFTGSRKAPSALQVTWLYQQLVELKAGGFKVLHHGDCVGGDRIAHVIAQELGYRITIHPPINPRLRAYCVADEVRPEKPYLIRNHDIVDESGRMLALPADLQAQRSGTWATIRYSRGKGVLVDALTGDGRSV